MNPRTLSENDSFYNLFRVDDFIKMDPEWWKTSITTDPPPASLLLISRPIPRFTPFYMLLVEARRERSSAQQPWGSFPGEYLVATSLDVVRYSIRIVRSRSVTKSPGTSGCSHRLRRAASAPPFPSSKAGVGRKIFWLYINSSLSNSFAE